MKKLIVMSILCILAAGCAENHTCTDTELREFLRNWSIKLEQRLRVIENNSEYLRELAEPDVVAAEREAEAEKTGQ